MIDETIASDIALILGWNNSGGDDGFRRNTTGFNRLKQLAESASKDNPLRLNAFLYAFLCPAKNLDLFLHERTAGIKDDIRDITARMDLIERFEREGVLPENEALRKLYLDMRKVSARPNARDEQRTLATLLFSGSSTEHQIANDLGISEDLAKRVLRVLDPVIESNRSNGHTLKSDINSLAVVLYILRCTLGLDPIRVLQRRITDLAQGGS